ncbi:hypothetical protein J2Z65_002250 [Paenibacillus aceris]|uniref:Uncharacterized protein n=1 Tax=Paenibacillus aceris TaxID=869555 RepID=A0ABS4HWJ3_9BACL|nr:hypothetical protein [Paenibacillus aceris]
MVDLKAKPFHLEDEGIAWVSRTTEFQNAVKV